MALKTSEKIIDIIKKRKQVSGKYLSEVLNIGDRAVRKQLNNLLKEGILEKIGTPPKVFYSINKEEKLEKIKIIKINKKIIDNNYLIITPAGKIKKGFDGFIYWCNKQNLNINKTAFEYIKTIKKYNKFKKDGLISGLSKMNNSFEKTYLNKVFYLDFYSIERFGKTKLGQLLLYSKQSQNKDLIKELSLIIKPKIDKLIKTFKIDALAFIPPTVKREVQLMKEIEKNLKLKVNKINLIKVKNEITVPQKTLSKINDRIKNAKDTIVVDYDNQHKNILLIDDAIGSGATLNETAKKIRELKISKNIIGLAITGSFKGFDVISEI
ncbi:MAG: HTH domain-containing protein [bacterium]